MKTFNTNKVTCKTTIHRNTNVILCFFAYDPDYLKEFKKNFPSAKWSQSNKAWYLPNTTLYRNRLGMQNPEVGDTHLDKIHSVNQEEFVKFRNALTQKMFSKNTIKTYLNEFSQLVTVLKNHPVYELEANRLNAYFLYCIKKLNHSENQIYSRMNAIKCYFKLVLNKEYIFDEVIRPKPTKSLPKVLSQYEIKKLFAATQNIKHLLLLKMAYGMGLRVSEIINLKVSHIDLNRFQAHIEGAKGKKDRYVNVPKSIDALFHDYLKTYQPVNYLFEGQFTTQYTARSAQMVFKNAMKKAGINKVIGIHGLRHSFATHLLEAGTDMVFIQKLLGHNQVKTTEIYAKVSTKVLSNVVSPLDTM